MGVDGFELGEAVKRSFSRSNSKRFNRLAGPDDVVDADYSSDKVFIGWNRGDIDDFRELFDYVDRNSQKQRRKDRFKQALQLFVDEIGEKREPVFLDRGEPDILVEAAARGSGKSFGLRAYGNRVAKAPDAIAVYIDVAGEYYTNNYKTPIQKRLANLRPTERRQSIPTAVLVPRYVKHALKQNDERVPGRDEDWHHLFQFGFDDLDVEDYAFLFRQMVDDDRKDVQMKLVQNINQQLRDNDLTISSWDDVLSVAERMQEDGAFTWENEYSKRIKPYVENYYKGWHLFGERCSMTDEEFADIFQRYQSVALWLDAGPAFPDDLRIRELYIALLIKRLRRLRRRGMINRPIDILWDEAHKDIPADTGPDFPPSKAQARQVVKEDRDKGFRVNLVTQEYEDLPDLNFTNAAEHVLIPSKANPGMAQSILQGDTNVAFTDNQGQDAGIGVYSRVWREMNRFWKLYVDVPGDWCCVLEPASPLAYHMEEA